MTDRYERTLDRFDRALEMYERRAADEKREREAVAREQRSREFWSVYSDEQLRELWYAALTDNGTGWYHDYAVSSYWGLREPIRESVNCLHALTTEMARRRNEGEQR